MQTYIVNKDYKKLGFGEKVNKLCKNLKVEIDEIDMLQFNNLILDSDKEYPFDGMTSYEIWQLNMATGSKLKQLVWLDLIDEDFEGRMLNIMRELMTFSSVADGAKLKYIEKD